MWGTAWDPVGRKQKSFPSDPLMAPLVTSFYSQQLRFSREACAVRGAIRRDSQPQKLLLGTPHFIGSSGLFTHK